MKMLRCVDDIVANQSLCTSEKIGELLELGLDFLGLGIGLVSSIENDVYKVSFAKSPGDMIAPGTTFDLGETYCWHTLQKKQVVAVHHAGLTSMSSHPCYEHFKLESYIGAPIVQQGRIVGTVNFSAAAARDPFSPEELAFVENLASWLGKALADELA